MHVFTFPRQRQRAGSWPFFLVYEASNFFILPPKTVPIPSTPLVPETTSERHNDHDTHQKDDRQYCVFTGVCTVADTLEVPNQLEFGPFPFTVVLAGIVWILLSSADVTHGPNEVMGELR